MKAPGWAQTLLDFANALRCSEAASYAEYLDSGLALNAILARKAARKICAVDPARARLSGSIAGGALRSTPMEHVLLRPFEGADAALASARMALSEACAKMSDKRRRAWSEGLEGAVAPGSWGEALLSALRPEIARAQARELHCATKKAKGSAKQSRCARL